VELQQILWFDEYTAHIKAEVKRDMHQEVELLIPELMARVEAESKTELQAEIHPGLRTRSSGAIIGGQSRPDALMLAFRGELPFRRDLHRRSDEYDLTTITAQVKAELMPKMKAEIKSQLKVECSKQACGDEDDLIKRFKSYWELWLDEKRKSLSETHTLGESARDKAIDRELVRLRDGMDRLQMQINGLHTFLSNLQASAYLERDRARLERHCAMLHQSK
jgi:hypothetical protein